MGIVTWGKAGAAGAAPGLHAAFHPRWLKANLTQIVHAEQATTHFNP